MKFARNYILFEMKLSKILRILPQCLKLLFWDNKSKHFFMLARDNQVVVLTFIWIELSINKTE